MNKERARLRTCAVETGSFYLGSAIKAYSRKYPVE